MSNLVMTALLDYHLIMRRTISFFAYAIPFVLPASCYAFKGRASSLKCWNVPVQSLAPEAGGLLPKGFILDGTYVRTSSGGTQAHGLTHAIGQTADGRITEFSTRNSNLERLATDHDFGRRSEVRLPGVLDAGIVYRGAYTFALRGWRGKQLVMGQAHAPKGIDGSPVWAFRRLSNGQAAIYVRSLSEHGPGSAIWHSDINWGVPHDLVFEVRYGRTLGYLTVWLDGSMIVNGQRWQNALVDSGSSGIYWKQGIYAALGQSANQMWVRYSNVKFHSDTWNAEERIRRPAYC